MNTFIRKYKSHITLILLSLLTSSISFNYFIFKNTKDAAILGSYSIGAEVITFIKLILILPFSILFSKLYPKLVKYVSPSKALLLSMIPMTIYIPMFVFVLFPYLSTHKIGILKPLLNIIPQSWTGLKIMLIRWDLSLLYILSELWGSIVLQVAFWGFMNDISTIKRAKEEYGILLAATSLAGICSNLFGILVYSNKKIIFPSLGHSLWEHNLNISLLSSVLVSLSGMLVFYALTSFNKKFNRHQEDSPIPESEFKNIEGLGKILKHHTVLCLSSTIVAMGLITTISEIFWKSLLSSRISDPCACATYLNKIGLSATVMSMFSSTMCNKIISKLGWKQTSYGIMLAVCIPAIVTLILCNAKLMFHSTMVLVDITIAAGAVQSALSRSMKISLYDATKDMALINLDRGVKVCGKSAIDSVMSRVGKLIASAFFVLSLLVLGSIKYCTVPGLIIVLIGTYAWFKAIKHINVQI